jgi:hypothetical protein
MDYTQGKGPFVMRNPFEGKVIIDGTHEYNLGVLESANTPHMSNHVYETYPTTFTFEISEPSAPVAAPAEPEEPQRPPEEQLLEEVIDVLESDSYKGSLPSTFVQSLVMNSPNYTQTVTGQYQGKWHAFLTAHVEIFHVFKYSSEEVRRSSMGHTCHANELRVALMKNKDFVLAEDIRRERLRCAAEQEVFEFLKALLHENGECDSQFLMKELEDHCPAYAEFTHPSYNVLERIVRMNDGTLFDVTQDEKQGTVVSLRK